MSVLVNKKNQREHDSAAQGLGHPAGDKQIQCRSENCLFSLFFFPHARNATKLISYERSRIQNHPLLNESHRRKLTLWLSAEGSLAKRCQVN